MDQQKFIPSLEGISCPRCRLEKQNLKVVFGTWGRFKCKAVCETCSTFVKFLSYKSPEKKKEDHSVEALQSYHKNKDEILKRIKERKLRAKLEVVN